MIAKILQDIHILTEPYILKLPKLKTNTWQFPSLTS